jgi:transcriptional regulator with PAS, ATPase and Fis domain
MLEIIKNKIWKLLKDKEVSLVMIFHRDGEILWHRGREIKGKSIRDGIGFCKSYIIKSMKDFKGVEKKDILVRLSVEGGSDSAEYLSIKSLLILPINEEFFVYIDSGNKEFFVDMEINSFRLLGELLCEVFHYIRERSGFKEITGMSDSAGVIRDLVLKYSVEDEPVLLTGETGSGKTHIARLIHNYSGRRGVFVVINTPSIQESLFESTLFGHKKGSFTDAISNKKGLVEEAEGGTLFFDEISEVPISSQSKLLRFIDTKRYRVLGENKEREADVRIIAATNRDLSEAIKNNDFREDLYYRLNTFEIEIPPLRERKEDIRGFVLENGRCLKGKVMGQGFWEELENYNWPGNVRELISVLKRVGVLSKNHELTGADVKKSIAHYSYRDIINTRKIDIDKTELIWEQIKSGKSFWEVLWKSFISRDVKRSEVKSIIKRFFLESDKNLKETAKKMGIKEKEYPRFISSIHKYKIHPEK